MQQTNNQANTTAQCHNHHTRERTQDVLVSAGGGENLCSFDNNLVNTKKYVELISHLSERTN